MYLKGMVTVSYLNVLGTIISSMDFVIGMLSILVGCSAVYLPAKNMAIAEATPGAIIFSIYLIIIVEG